MMITPVVCKTNNITIYGHEGCFNVKFNNNIPNTVATDNGDYSSRAGPTQRGDDGELEELPPPPPGLCILERARKFGTIRLFRRAKKQIGIIAVNTEQKTKFVFNLFYTIVVIDYCVTSRKATLK